MTQTLSITPELLLRDEGAFALASSDFVLIQMYAENALALPKTADEFRAMLGEYAPPDIGEFEPLIAVYQTMFNASKIWKDQTFPGTVRLASDLIAYGKKAPRSFGKLLEHAQRLTADENDAVSKNALRSILGGLEQDAREMHERATAALSGVTEFAEVSRRDAEILAVQDGGGLLRQYRNRAEGVNDRVAALRNELASHQEALRQANETHAHDATVAGTSAAYAWIFPFGTIAAAIVAGVYGQKAMDAIAAANRLQAEIDSISGEGAAQTRTLVSLQMASDSILRIVAALARALPVLQTIRGFWSGIADDLAAITAMIDRDVRGAAAIIMDLGIEGATRSWETVAAAAARYRDAAIVEVVDLERWKSEHPEAFASGDDVEDVA